MGVEWKLPTASHFTPERLLQVALGESKSRGSKAVWYNLLGRWYFQNQNM